MPTRRGATPSSPRGRAYTGSRARTRPRPWTRGAAQRGRGVVVLPTGSGKSHVAVLAIEDKRRSTLVVAPTLDLVRQWYDLLRTTFGLPVGVVGGGEHDVQALTVTTYDSAYLHMEHLGRALRAGRLRRVPPPARRRLFACRTRMPRALSPGPDCDARAERRPRADLDELIGPTSTARTSSSSPGDYLAEYETERVVDRAVGRERAPTTPSAPSTASSSTSHGIRMSRALGLGRVHHALLAERRGPARDGWPTASNASSLSRPKAKLDYLEHLLHLHRRDRAILFTQDNATAYAISRRFLVPVMTHQTKVRERSEILAGLGDGHLPRSGHRPRY